MTEQEFGLSFKNFLNKAGIEAWHEVYVLGRSIDTIIRIDNKYIALELKMSASEQVILQARKNKRHANLSYVVIPYKKDFSHIKKFYMLKNGIGGLSFESCEHDCYQYTFRFLNNLFKTGYNLNHLVVGESKDIFGRYYIENFLKEGQKSCIPGSITGSVITPFKTSCKLIVEFLEFNKDIKNKKEIWEALKDKLHWMTYGGFLSSFRNFPDLEPLIKINEILNKRREAAICTKI